MRLQLLSEHLVFEEGTVWASRSDHLSLVLREAQGGVAVRANVTEDLPDDLSGSGSLALIFTNCLVSVGGDIYRIPLFRCSVPIREEDVGSDALQVRLGFHLLLQLDAVDQAGNRLPVSCRAGISVSGTSIDVSAKDLPLHLLLPPDEYLAYVGIGYRAELWLSVKDGDAPVRVVKLVAKPHDP